jgi:hypothetical protein
MSCEHLLRSSDLQGGGEHERIDDHRKTAEGTHGLR